MSTAPAAPARAPAKTSGWLKVLIGCGALVCLVGFLCLVAVGYGVYWALSPGRQIATAAVASPSSEGTIWCGDIRRDPGARAVLRKLTSEMMKADEADLPPLLRPFQEMQRAQAGDNFSQWLPREATLSLERAPDAEGLQLIGAANFRMYVRVMRKAVESVAEAGGRSIVTRNGDDSIVDFGNGTVVAFYGGTIVYSTHRPLLEGVRDRAGTTPGVPSAVTPSDAAFGTWDVEGRLTSPDGVATFLEFVRGAAGTEEEPAPELPAMSSGRFGVDFVLPDDMKARVELAPPVGATAPDAVPAFEAVLARAREKAAAAGLAMTSSVKATGSGVQIEVHIPGVGRTVGQRMADRQRARNERLDELEAEAEAEAETADEPEDAATPVPTEAP